LSPACSVGAWWRGRNGPDRGCHVGCVSRVLRESGAMGDGDR